jgi:hypothetical protein
LSQAGEAVFIPQVWPPSEQLKVLYWSGSWVTQTCPDIDREIIIRMCIGQDELARHAGTVALTSLQCAEKGINLFADN